MAPLLLSVCTMDIQNQGIIRPHKSKLIFVFRILDAAVIFFLLLLSSRWFGLPVDEDYYSYSVLGLLAVVAFSVFSETLQVYISLRVASVGNICVRITLCWLLVVFLCALIGYFARISTDYSRAILGLWIVITPVTLILLRLVIMGTLAQLRRRGYNTQTVAIVGAESHGERLAAVINAEPRFGYRLLGFFDDRKNPDRIQPELKNQVVGCFEELIRRAKLGQVDLIYIALSSKAQTRIAGLIDQLRDTAVSVHLVPDFFIYDLLHSRWANIGPVPTLSVFESPFASVYGWVKRLEDIVLSLIILVIILLPMLAIAIGVKLSSPGPVIFKQRRYGMDGKQIKIWKFRSMKACDDGDTVVQAKRNDMRVTRFGAFLRRTSLDELPQFINVLMGDMSIVGPRPHAVAHNEEYRKLISGYMLRHKVPPGITGWAQVNGWRGETDTVEKMQKRIEFDLWYIRRWSVWLDLQIIFKTLFNGFKNQNAF